MTIAIFAYDIRRNKMDEKDLKVVTDEVSPDVTAREMAKSISKMYEDRDKKAQAAKDRLLSQLEVTVDKYRTANGVMSALATLRDVLGPDNAMSIEEEIGTAKTIASKMAEVTQEMANKAYDLFPDNMDELCNHFYDREFSEHDASALDMATELMVLQLCQNVGPNAEDIVEFLRHADEEIDKARENLKTFCDDNGLNFNEICGPHEDCYWCLCESCLKSCKDHKLIKEGESTRDVCKDFVADLSALE